MPGNVGEGCLDAEHANYFGAPTNGSAWGLGGGCQRGGFMISRKNGAYPLLGFLGLIT